MLAYLGKSELKAFVLDQLAQHRKADKLVHGQYWEAGKGCAVGCTLEAVRLYNGAAHIDHGDHDLYGPLLGWPPVLAYLKDHIFEELDNDTAQAWPERFCGAIRVGADLSMAWPRFALWLLAEELPPHTAEYPRCAATLAGVAALYRQWIEGKKPIARRWQSAATSAAASAIAAAIAAAAEGACDAACAAAAAACTAEAACEADAACAAVYGSAYACDYACAACPDAAARQDCWRRMADKLIAIMESASCLRLSAGHSGDRTSAVLCRDSTGPPVNASKAGLGLHAHRRPRSRADKYQEFPRRRLATSLKP